MKSILESHASLQNGTEEVDGLQPQSNFRLTFHKMFMEAPELFGPCAMQNLYIHESAEFKDIDQASAVVACAEERPGLIGTAKRMPGMQYAESYPPLEQLYHRCSCSLAPQCRTHQIWSSASTTRCASLWNLCEPLAACPLC